MPLFITHAVRKAFLHLWYVVFHEPAPEAALRHLDRFLVFGVGMVTAKLVSVAAQILIGRVLGQADYGQLTIVLLLAAYFAVPIVGGWGLAFTRIVANEAEPGLKVEALNSLLLVSSLLGALVCGLLLILRGDLGDWLGIGSRLVDVTIVMTLLYAWWILAKQITQAFQAWRTYVAIEISLSVILLAVVLGLVFWGRARLFPIAVAFWIAYGLAGLGAARFVVGAARMGMVFAHIKPIVRHGGFLLLSGLVTVSTYSMDRIIIHKTLGPESVGLYQAHFMATFGIISALLTILLAYLFPLFCRNQSDEWGRRLGRASLMQYPLTMLVSAGVGTGVLRLYGYPLSVPLFVCLTLFSAVQFHVQMKAWYLSSKGADATLIALGSQLTFLALNAIILVILVGRLGVVSGGIALLAGAFGSLLYLICSGSS